MRKLAVIIVLVIVVANPVLGQICTNLGQTPESAFPVCGTQAFVQTTVPICGNINMPVPCNDGAQYQNKNPFWYKFTCFGAGTLGFTITPSDLSDDYDWQLFDVTNHNPNDVFTDPSLFVACNWSGESGTTGASSSGTGSVNCAGTGVPLFNSMPTLIQGHEYLLLVSHFTPTLTGYQIIFTGGTANITDPIDPKISYATISCDGSRLSVRLNKKLRCNSLAADGSDFTLVGANILSAAAVACSNGFDTDSVLLILDRQLPPGTYTVTAKNGTDGNTMLDLCSRPIPDGSGVDFVVAPLLPTPMDSLRPIGCAPATLQLVFRRQIRCPSIAPNGSDFILTGPQGATITGFNAPPSCNTDGFTNTITLQLSAPLVLAGQYTITLTNGSDGNTLIDECGRATPAGAVINFNVADTVNADFTYANLLGCRNDTLTFTHDGRNGVNSWNWTFDNTVRVATQTVTQIYSAQSTHTAKLVVSNGVCRDSTTQTITLDNQVIASFNAEDYYCPEDSVVFLNTSSGVGFIDSWHWTFGNGNISTAQIAPPQRYPQPGREMIYTVKLVANSSSLDCSDSATHTFRVLGSCYIAVPSAFTPNNDGLNDFLYPLNALKAENLEFKIFNRWGQLMFASKSWLDKWDGKVNGREQGTGVYVWFLRFTHRDTKQQVFLKGYSTLIR